MQIEYLSRAFVAVTLLASAAAWESEWIHGVQPTDQDKFMVIKALQDLRTEVKDAFTQKPLPWYTLADLTSPRLEPLCALRMMRTVAGQWKFSFCSCSFVKPDMVATAAHCLTVNGVTPKSEHALWVQQLYGKGNDPDFSKYPVNLVTEWWYSAAFAAGGSIMHDIALLRTKAKGSKAYQMMTPVDTKQAVNVESDEVSMVGYPVDAATHEVAVISSGKFKTPEEGITYIENTFAYLPTLYPKRRPIMQTGASGGPIIVSDATLTKYKANAEALKKEHPKIADGWTKAADTIKMGLFGVISKARTEAPFNMNFAITFTDKLLKAAEHIYSKGAKDATIEKRANDEQLVKLAGI